MNYHLDTIPVWDAAKLDSECLFCALEVKTENDEAERYLGASVMEPDIRVRVNDKGFCRRHHAMLYGMNNRLGHALMLESHTIETRERLDKAFGALEKAGKALADSSMGERLTGKTKSAMETIRKEAEAIEKIGSTCVMCDTIEENMARYAHTFFHLYRNDSEFRRVFNQGKGLCVPHTAMLITTAAQEMNQKELGEFIVSLCRNERENLNRIQEDISWFIKKFDYRYEKEDWKNSRDAVERTANKMRGTCVNRDEK